MPKDKKIITMELSNNLYQVFRLHITKASHNKNRDINSKRYILTFSIKSCFWAKTYQNIILKGLLILSTTIL